MFIKKVIVICCSLLFSSHLFAQSDKYVYSIDLTNVQDDKVKVVLTPPAINTAQADFIMPSIVPGTYSRKDYGRFIIDLKAFDRNGKELPVVRKNSNLFSISQAQSMSKVEYWVNDTWDDTDTKNYVFQPSGTNIEAGKNFVINPHAYFGYFDGHKNAPFELRFATPEGMFGSTPLTQQKDNGKQAVYAAKNYVELADSPMMFCLPDTTSFVVGGARIYVSVYSPNKKVASAQVASYLQPLGHALENFFGKLPTKHYHFIMYYASMDMMMPDAEGLSGYGALEHNYSSMYFLPESDAETAVKQMVLDVCSHEFLHILTPLNVHSEQIEDFNFVKPEMSRHLWMYEGITEYFAHLSQLRAGLIGPEDFMDKMREKIIHADGFKPLSFTKMSQRIVEDTYQKDYLNVYEKGALIGFALDLELSRLSKGKYGLRDLMLDLAKKYGPNKPFNDKKFINEVVKMTYPEIKTFFKKYVTGDKTIDYDQYLHNMGWQYSPAEQVMGYSFGNFGIGFNPEKMKLSFVEVQENKFGLKENDLLLKINDEEVTMENVQDLLVNNLLAKRDDTPVRLTIEREGSEMTLSGTPDIAARSIKHVLKPAQDPSAEQLSVQNFLFTGKK